MSRKTGVILVVCIVLVAVVAFSAYAVQQQTQQPLMKHQGQNAQMGSRAGGGPGAQGMGLQGILMPPRPQQLEKLYQAIGATEEQKQQINALQEECKNKVKPVMEEKHAAMKEVAETLRNPEASQGQLESAVNKVEKADKAIVDAELAFWKGFKKVLTSEQQAKLADVMKQKGEGSGPGMGREGMKPGGGRQGNYAGGPTPPEN